MTYTKLAQSRWQICSARSQGVPGGGGQCRLGQGRGLLPDPDRSGGRRQLADHRRQLHPDARRQQGCTDSPGAQVLRLGLSRTARRWPKIWTTCRCRTAVSKLVEKTWQDSLKVNGKPAWPASRPGATLISGRAARLMAVAITIPYHAQLRREARAEGLFRVAHGRRGGAGADHCWPAC